MSRPHVPAGAAQVLTDSLQELEHVDDKDVINPLSRRVLRSSDSNPRSHKTPD